MMKRKSGYMILTVTAALCIGTSLPFLLVSSVLNPERQSVKSEIPYCVTSPTVPAKIAFAGQEVDLLRFDHRERMDRELKIPFIETLNEIYLELPKIN